MKNLTIFTYKAAMAIASYGIASTPTILAQSQPAVAPVSMSSATNSAPTTQPKFGDLSVQDRNAILEKIGKQDFPVIMQAFLDAGRVEHDSGKQDMVWRILGGAMRQRTPPPEFFAQLKTFIADSSNSNLERGQIIAALGEAATKESADVLIYEATTLKDNELKNVANNAIGRLGDRSDDVNLAPALDKLWQQSHDQQILMSASLAMVGISAPSSINLLLSAALASDGLDNTRKHIAEGALTTVISKRAVPPLAAALVNQPPANPQAALAFATLAQIPDPIAAHALIAWLQAADDSAAPLALSWITHAKHDAQLKAATAALDPNVPFSSEANREALRAGLEAKKNSGFDVIHEVPRKQ